MAEEADRLSSIVSYGRDKLRLKEQAKNWRDQAAVVAAAPPTPPSVSKPARDGMLGWLRGRKG